MRPRAGADTFAAVIEANATYEVRGGRDVRLHVAEWGDANGPAILFVHGWSQSHLCWRRQLESALADDFRLVALDLRGHGMSQKPAAPDPYTDGRAWADDVAAVIDELSLDRPVLVVWSYGGFVVGDYVRAYGDERIGAVDLVGAAVMLTPTFDHLGPGLLANASEACSPDLGTAIAAVQRFLRACTAAPLASADWDAALCWNMVVPPEVRGALISRRIDSTDLLAKLSVPVLVTHGRADDIVLPSMAEHVLEVCPVAEASWYEGVGHMPFWEDAERFNRELSRLAGRASSGSSRPGLAASL
jgi:pimeloyl-ACP methyl ester carboxylesterase